MEWQDIAKNKQEQRQSLLPQEWRLDCVPASDVKNVQDIDYPLSSKDVEIIHSSASRIVDMIAASEWTAVEVTTAFGRRATHAQQLLNAITEINFTAALQRAAELDAYLKANGKTIGPLHGLPMSFKDSIDIERLGTSMGYCAWADNVAKEDSVIVNLFRAAGAIPLCKTNVGFTLMIGETVNHLFGRTLNPYNRTLTSGGSSGGESALLAFHGSPVGIGTDIGGSIRLPSASCGLWGLRPSHGRVSYRGLADTFVGQLAVRSVAGPMGNDPEDLALIMSTYLAGRPWLKDPEVVPIPWRENVLPAGPLCFAFSEGDELVTPHSPILRGLSHTIGLLRRAGHRVIKWEGSLMARQSSRLMNDFWTADGGKDVLSVIEKSGEPMMKEVSDLLRLDEDPPFTPPDVYKTWQNQHERALLSQAFSDRWQATAQITGTGRPIDGLILPTAPFTARPHGANLPESRFGVFEYTYANLQPIFDLTSAAFPTGLRQDPAIDVPESSFEPRSKLDQTVHDLYTDPSEWEGAPIGLQLFARRFEEEKVLAMLGIIKEALA